MPATVLPVRCDRWTAMRRGLRLRCPACGRGALLRSYLTLSERCTGCGTALGELRGDDGPAWATILLTGILAAPCILIAIRAGAPDWVFYGVLMPLALVLILALLPRAKGVFAALMWALDVDRPGATAAAGGSSPGESPPGDGITRTSSHGGD